MFIKGSWAGVFACKVLCRSFPILPLFTIDVIFKALKRRFYNTSRYKRLRIGTRCVMTGKVLLAKFVCSQARVISRLI